MRNGVRSVYLGDIVKLEGIKSPKIREVYTHVRTVTASNEIELGGLEEAFPFKGSCTILSTEQCASKHELYCPLIACK